MRAIPLNDLSRISSDEVEKLTDVFRMVCLSGTYLKGSLTRTLEAELSRLLDDRPVVAVGSGTDALTIAIAALGLGPDRKVAVAPNAGGYGTIASRRLRLRTAMIDVDPLTAQMDPRDLRLRLADDPEIGAVIVTHLYGLCGEVEEIASACAEHGIALIEDCAQSIGAAKGGRASGTFGALSTFSFYPTKNLGALGDGGAVSASTDALASRVSQLAQYGWGERYTVELPDGFNSRLDEIQAGILVERLKTLKHENERRKAIIARYAEAVSKPRYLIHDSSEAFVGHLAVLVSPARQQDVEILNAAGIGTGVHYPVLDSAQPAWQDFRYASTPVAAELATRIITLPCFPTMTEEEIARICSALGSL